jgi:hypothetical protein
MATILAPTVQADSTNTTTAAFGFDGSAVVTATCTNSVATPPSNACQCQLQLSVDGVNWKMVDTRWFGFGPITYFATFNMSDYSALPQEFGLTAPWLYYRLYFAGNVGAAVTIAAMDTSSRAVAVIPLVATTSTGGGAVAAWTPPEGGPVFITRAYVTIPTPSTGAATVTFGTAANATTSSGNLMTTLNVAASVGMADNITNASTSGKSCQYLAAGSYVTATASASVVGMVGTLYVDYTKL